jgi:RimJ/RimL family protein N-acetyltransferase
VGATVRRLTAADAEAYVVLRREMLLDTPLAFSSSPEDDRGLDLARMRGGLADGTTVLFGAFDPGLLGTVGLARETHRKAAHLATVWGMYVTPARRRTGLGRALLTAAIAHARTLPGLRQLSLGVNETTPGARALYESLGFVRWGTEPRAVFHDGRFAAEDHMSLSLDGPDGPP